MLTGDEVFMFRYLLVDFQPAKMVLSTKKIRAKNITQMKSHEFYEEDKLKFIQNGQVTLLSLRVSWMLTTITTVMDINLLSIIVFINKRDDKKDF